MRWVVPSIKSDLNFWFIFRNLKWVIMPLLGCATSVIIMIGLLGLLGGINRKGPAGFDPNRIINFRGGPFQARPAVMQQMGYAEGGEVAPGMPQGMQVDGRNGTFIPMGVQEKADDVPAMLSKNEFVMTADAVKGLGNGSPELGAQRMYDLMNNLETKV